MTRELAIPELSPDIPAKIRDVLEGIIEELDLRAGNVPKAKASAYIAVEDLTPKTITLIANVAVTPLNDSRLTANSAILFVPLTSNAAAAQAGVYFTGRQDGKCTINHANNAQTDKSFEFTVIG